MRRGTAQVLVSVIRVPPHAAFGGAFRVGHFGTHGELLGHELGGDFVHCIHGYGEAVSLLAVEAKEVVSEEGGGLACTN